MEKQLHEYIETVPDFPKPGVQFKSISKLLRTPVAFEKIIKLFAERFKSKNIDVIVGLDARGFVFAAAISYEMSLPFVMVRKGGKLAKPVERVEYNLEYGTSIFEIEKDSIKKGDRVVVVDDLLTTGGSASAGAKLVEKLGGEVVEVACLIELEGLNGRGKLKHPFFALIDLKDVK